jgi:ElaB/YqjD/DUF883 family membrane-anchored ribosome-binding protein
MSADPPSTDDPPTDDRNKERTSQMPDSSGSLDPDDSAAQGLKHTFGLHHEIQALKDDMKAVRSDLAALAEKAGEVAGAEAKRQAGKAEALAGDAKAAAESYADLLEDKIRTHPLASVGIALVAGMVISSMGRR